MASKRIPVCRYETRGVLAGAYRGKNVEERALRTHLVALDGCGNGLLDVCGQNVDHMVDTYGHTDAELLAAPTCPKCLVRWAKIRMSGELLVGHYRQCNMVFRSDSIEIVFENDDEFTVWALEYAASLRAEIDRITAGAACAPWLSKEQDLRDALVEADAALQEVG